MILMEKMLRIKIVWTEINSPCVKESDYNANAKTCLQVCLK